MSPDRSDSVADRPSRSVSRKASRENRELDELVNVEPSRPPESGQPKKRAKNPLRSIYRYREWLDTFLIFGGMFFAVGQGVLPPINMILLGNVVNTIGGTMDKATFNKIIVEFALLAVVGFVFGTMNTTLFEIAAERQVRTLKSEYFRALTRQEMGFFDLRDVGTLASEIEQTCVHVRDGAGMKLGLIFQSASQFISGYVVGLVKGWQMALVLSAIIPLIGGSMGFMVTKLRKKTEESKEAYELAGSQAEEVLSSMRTIASFSGEERVIEAFNSKLNVSMQKDLEAAFFKATGFSIVFGLLFLSYALGWWYAGKTVGNAIVTSGGENTEVGGNVVTVFFSIIIASFSLGQLLPNANAVIVGAKSAEDVHRLIDRRSEIDPEIGGGKVADGLTGAIEFRDVEFCFPSRPEKPIYAKISFRIEPGETVALVGSSGCGKSTIVQLLERFYDCQEGEILVDGTPIREYNLQSLRSQMALVSQEPRLFTDTINTNIRYGKLDASDDEIEEAAKKANAHTFISTFPNKYETNVGEGGSLLSGGQKQRVAIARAILRDPAVLILDEATSALDNESEKVVQAALDDLIKMKRRTTIIIAHRLTTIRTADKIVVLDNPDGHGSRVIENGRHEDLMKIEHGLYKALVDAQTEHKGTKAAELARQEILSTLSRELIKPMPKETSERSRDAAASRMLRKYSRVLPEPEEGQNAELSSQSHQGGSPRTLTRQASKVIVEAVGATENLADVRTMRIFKFMREDRWIVILGCIAAAVTGASWPITSSLIAQFIGIFYDYDDTKSPEENADYVDGKSNMLALIFVVVAVLIAVAYFTQQYCFGWSGERLVARTRKWTFEAMVYQDMEFFDAPMHNTGHLSAILSADCATLRGVSGDNLSIIIQNGMTIIAAIVIAFLSYAKLAAVAIAAFSLVVPAVMLQGRSLKVATVQPDALLNTDTAAFLLNEVITSLRVVAAYGLQSELHNRYYKVLDKEYGVGRRNGIITGITAGFAGSLMFAGNALSYWYGGMLLYKSAPGLDMTKMMRTILVVMMAANGVGRGTAWATDAKKAKAATRNVLEILERPSKIDVRDPSGLKTDFEPNFTFKHVKFRYPNRPEAPVLGNVSFPVASGQMVALVGASGCGKSTIIQLLERFYDLSPSRDLRIYIARHNLQVPSPAIMGDSSESADENKPSLVKLPSASKLYGGEVLVGDEPIGEYNLRYWRSQFGLVQQEPILFSTTIKGNIKWGKDDATDEEVILAAKLANAHEFISKLPDGYDSEVGKGGGQLSGGQKQRVAIARAIIRNPKILLLDEATSALDPESEEIVQRSLDELLSKQKRTTIVIAHRLTTIRNADLIVVFAPNMDVGSSVVEMGTHDELMKITDGIYRHLVEISQGRT